MKSNKNLFLLLVNTFILVLGIGLLMPIMPLYAEQFGANGKILGLLIAVFPLSQFLFSTLGGKLSDCYGRKKIIAISMLGYAISQILFGMANSMWILFFARFISGIFGAGFLPAAMAYITDVTTEENRTKAMGIYSGVFTLGMAIAPGIGGYLAQVSMRFPFYIAGIAGIIGGLFSLFALPETLSKKQFKENKLKKNNKVSFAEQISKIIKTDCFLFLVLMFTMSVGLSIFTSIIALYSYKANNFTTIEFSTLITVISILGTVIQMGLIGKLTKRFGEISLLNISLLATAIGFILLVISKGKILFSISVAFFFVFMSLLRPILNALISKNAGEDKGEVMGLNNTFMSFGNMIGPIISGILFDIKMYMPFLLGLIIMIASSIVLNISAKSFSKNELSENAI